MRMNLGASSVTQNGDVWELRLVMANDNDYPNGVLPSSFRRWWGLQVDNLAGGEVLNVEVSNSGYSDTITPVWSVDGGAAYQRIPGPYFASGSNHLFSVTVPDGVQSIRLYKYYPYTIDQYDAFRAPLADHPFVAVEDIGDSVQGRDIWMYTVTNTTVPDAGKERIWIHNCVHPAENTGYFVMEGLFTWLASGTPAANEFLSHTILNIVPMANPDGNALGNYRTNANGVNLENEWSFPYDSTQPEIVALRTKIEEFMGTEGNPGSNPIRALLNVHSTHGGGFPYHFVHVGSYPPSGVIPAVNALEVAWVDAFKARSPFVAAGNSASSTLGSTRPFVESMMHDRYTIAGIAQWEPVMAITFEGTYQAFPGRSTPSNEDDYRDVGEAMGLALMDYFGIDEVFGWDAFLVH